MCCKLHTTKKALRVLYRWRCFPWERKLTWEYSITAIDTRHLSTGRTAGRWRPSTDARHVLHCKCYRAWDCRSDPQVRGGVRRGRSSRGGSSLHSHPFGVHAGYGIDIIGLVQPAEIDQDAPSLLQSLAKVRYVHVPQQINGNSMMATAVRYDAAAVSASIYLLTPAADLEHSLLGP